MRIGHEDAVLRSLLGEFGHCHSCVGHRDWKQVVIGVEPGFDNPRLHRRPRWRRDLELQANIDDFDRRTFALSGVSGGAVGTAAYSACLRTAPPAAADRATGVSDCLKQAFARLDPLSPLLGAWLFEDALARVLPVPMATDPARSGSGARIRPART